MAPTIAELSSPDASEGSTPPIGNDGGVFYNHVVGGNESQSVEPIAIIGMGMRLPGGIHDAESFWNLLIADRLVSTQMAGHLERHNPTQRHKLS